MASKQELTRKITNCKVKITKAANKLINNQNIDDELIKFVWDSYEVHSAEIDEAYDAIITLSESDDAFAQADVETFIDLQMEYKLDIARRMALLKSEYSILNNIQATEPVADQPEIANQPNTNFQSSPFQLPKIEMPHFSDNKNGPCEYVHFKNQFFSALENMRGYSDVNKFTYLLLALEGKARALVSSSNVTNHSITNAFEILDRAFLDEEKIIEQTINFLKEYPDLTNSNCIEEFITILRCKLSELREFSMDFELEGSPGNVLLSNIIRSKLPNYFLTELCRRSKKSYPKIEDLLEHGCDVCKLHPYKNNKKAERNTSNSNSTGAKGGNPSNNPPPFNRRNTYDNSNHNQNKQNYDAKSYVKTCKFCSSTDHNSTNCNRYTSHNERKNRALTLKKCIRCLSTMHADCIGFPLGLKFECEICQTKRHCTPMCPDYIPKAQYNPRKTT